VSFTRDTRPPAHASFQSLAITAPDRPQAQRQDAPVLRVPGDKTAKSVIEACRDEHKDFVFTKEARTRQ